MTSSIIKRNSITNAVKAAWARQKARQDECGSDGDERGSILILAMIFIVVVSVTVLTLANWTTSDLNNSTQFTNARSTDYATSSVVNVAINSIRYTPLPAATPTQNTPTALGECWTPESGTVSQLTTVENSINYTVTAWCTTTENLASANTRVVDIYACLSTVTASACEISPLLHVEVTFDDYPAGDAPLDTTQCSTTTTCGQSVTINKWDWA